MSISPGTVLVLIFAVLFGPAGAYAVNEQLRTTAAAPAPEPAASAPEPPPTYYLPTASNDLPANRPLTLSDIAVYKLTAEQLASRNVPREYMGNPEQIVGRVLKAPLSQGQAFETSLFYPEGMGQSVADRLAPGLRAVTIAVEGTGALEGLIDVSSHVDVLFRTLASDDLPRRTVTLVQDAEVLAVDRNTLPGAINSASSSTVTLAVDSHEAQALKVAEGRGEFSLSLRSAQRPGQDIGADAGQPTSTLPGPVPRDSAEVPETLEGLLQLPRTRFKAEIYRGTARSDVEFALDPRDQGASPAVHFTSRPTPSAWTAP